MAPTAKMKTADPKPTTASKSKGRDRIVKRRARGFHRFRNGMLNVTPKGGEKELVKRNQNSPLLRLPAELRTQIWNYVLGYKLLSMWYTYKLPLRQARIAAPYTDRTNVMDLLRTCRQIYVESACVPYSLNIFSFDFYDSIYDHFKRFTLHQRANITHIQLNNLDHFSLQLLTQQPIEVVAKQKKFNLSFLPALKQIHVVLLAAQFDAAQEGRGHMVEDQLKVLLAGSRNVEILLETTSKTKTWDKYVAGWSYPTY